jgi:hypothetical protein
MYAVGSSGKPTFPPDPNLVFDEAAHRYELQHDPDCPLVSVTQMTKSLSRPFDELRTAARVAARDGVSLESVLNLWKAKRERASDIGNIVHAEAERVAWQIDRRGFFSRRDFGEREHGYVAGVYKFYEQHPELSFSWAVPELRIYNQRLGLAGTVDLICGFEGIPAIADFKTSEQINLVGYSSQKLYAPANHLPASNYWHYAFQLNTYRLMMMEAYDYEADRLLIVWVGSDGSMKEVFVPILDSELLEAVLQKAKKKREKK